MDWKQFDKFCMEWAETLQAYTIGQAMLWQQIPYWALHANGKDGLGRNAELTRICRTGTWAPNEAKALRIDCATGRFGFFRGIITSGSDRNREFERCSDHRRIFELMLTPPDRFDAACIMNALYMQAHRDDGATLRARKTNTSITNSEARQFGITQRYTRLTKRH